MKRIVILSSFALWVSACIYAEFFTTGVFAAPPPAKTVDGGQGDIRQNFYVKTMTGARFFYRVWDGKQYGPWWEEIRSNVVYRGDGSIYHYRTKKGKLGPASQKNLNDALVKAYKDIEIVNVNHGHTHTINYTGNFKIYGRPFRYGY